MRIGIMTLREKWAKWLNVTPSVLTETYLSEKFPAHIDADNVLINSRILPDAEFIGAVQQLSDGAALFCGETLLAVRLSRAEAEQFGNGSAFQPSQRTDYQHVTILNRLPDLFQMNDFALRQDFALLTANRDSEPLSDTNLVIGDAANIFVEPGAVVEGAILNCKEGPIYIGEAAEVMEGSVIRAPFALCEHAQVKVAAKIYGATTIGPHCKVGGELNNVLFFGYSNKAHDGFLGNTVVGEWCNFGADSNTSNLKNNYGSIRLWDGERRTFADTGTQFCGLFMGDHSKCGINSMFNSGTVVGVCANLFGAGYFRNFVPSFAYGGPTSGYTVYDFEKAVETAERVWARRSKAFTAADRRLLETLFRAQTSAE